MNSTRSFKLLSLGIVVIIVATGGSGAVTISEQNAPSEVPAGDQVTSTFVFGDLYRNPSMESWSLRGETELRNVTWTVQSVNQADSVIDQRAYDGRTFQHPIRLDDGVATVNVRLSGSVPAVTNFTYTPAPSFLFAAFTQTREGGSRRTIQTYQTRHFTAESQRARSAIESARSAIDDAGGHQEATRILESAISAYEVRNFENAVNLANQAEERATSASRQSQLIRNVTLGVVGLVVLAAIIGVGYWYRQRQGDGGTL